MSRSEEREERKKMQLLLCLNPQNCANLRRELLPDKKKLPEHFREKLLPLILHQELCLWSLNPTYVCGAPFYVTIP